MPELHPAFLETLIAHRGLHDRKRGVIENSRAAVRAAIEAGFAVEIDVQAAGCGTAMVFHDATLDRLTDRSGPIRAETAEALGAVPLIGGGETIPGLPEILALVAGRVPLLVEVKDQDGALGPEVGALEARVSADLAGYEGPVALMSFNPHSVGALAGLASGIARGLTSCAFRADDWPLPAERRAALAALEDFEGVGASFVSHDHRDLANPAIVALKARGVPVLAWTIRSAAQEAAARRVADNVTFEGYIPPRAD